MRELDSPYEYVFGPVSSGRLGLSLGLDLLSAPVCSLDCVYCEVGRTRELTLERRPLVPAEAILDELSHWKAAGGEAEFVTLGGMGEPCLNTEMGRIIDGAREIMGSTPVAVLTNSTLLADESVREDIARADVILPSLDTLVEREFLRLNRPARGLTAADVASALLDFSKTYPGRIFLEILLVAGMNDSQENLDLLADYVPGLSPDRVDVVTMTRPGAHKAARPVAREVLERWQARLGARSEFPLATQSPFKRTGTLTSAKIREIVKASLSRRPQTASQLSSALGIGEEETAAALGELIDSGELSERNGFYGPRGRL